MKSQIHGFNRNTVIYATPWQLSSFELEVAMCLRERVKSRVQLHWQVRSGIWYLRKVLLYVPS
jgi:hypothetical protein